jgi:drug/metabolite transporter (DMT)-like permease
MFQLIADNIGISRCLSVTSQRKAYMYALLTILCWATVASAFKLSLQYLDYLHLLFYSSLTSSLVLFLVLVVEHKFPLLFTYSRWDYFRSALLGFLNPYLYYMILFNAYLLLPAQEAQPINQLWAIVLSLLSVRLLKQQFKLSNFVALFISLVGVLVISTQGNVVGLEFSNPLGVLLALSTTIIWALFWVYNLNDARDETVKLFLNFIFGSLYTLLSLLFMSTIVPVNLPGFLSAVYVGLFEMGLPFLFWLKALQYSSTTVQVSTLVHLVPFLSLLVIHFTIGEPILPSTLLGLFLIITGILVQQRMKI